MTFDDLVIVIAWGVALWVWVSSVGPWLDRSGDEIMEWVLNREEDDAR